MVASLTNLSSLPAAAVTPSRNNPAVEQTALPTDNAPSFADSLTQAEAQVSQQKTGSSARSQPPIKSRRSVDSPTSPARNKNADKPAPDNPTNAAAVHPSDVQTRDNESHPSAAAKTTARDARDVAGDDSEGNSKGNSGGGNEQKSTLTAQSLQAVRAEPAGQSPNNSLAIFGVGEQGGKIFSRDDPAAQAGDGADHVQAAAGGGGNGQGQTAAAASGKSGTMVAASAKTTADSAATSTFQQHFSASAEKPADPVAVAPAHMSATGAATSLALAAGQTATVDANAGNVAVSGAGDGSGVDPSPAPGATAMDPNVASVARGLQSALAQRGGVVTLRLQPPELGLVRIQMEVRDGVVRASFQTEHESVRTLLNHDLGQLRQVLEKQGLAVQQLEVQVRPAAQVLAGQYQTPGEGFNDGRSRGQMQQQGTEQQSRRDEPGLNSAEESGFYDQLVNMIV